MMDGLPLWYPTGVGGVLILLLTKIALRYGITAQVICPGAIIAITSTRICRFSLINRYFSPYGRQLRTPQYEALRAWLTKGTRRIITLGGDFQRCEGLYCMWIFQQPGKEAHWGEANHNENAWLQQRLWAPMQLTSRNDLST